MEPRHRTSVLITIDTEFSLGGYLANSDDKPVPADKCIYCRIGESTYGIGFIMDILEANGLKGVFFLESESRFYFGENVLVDILTQIQQRGHEVQLHIHPAWRTFIRQKECSDDLRDYSLDEQKNIINDALGFFNKHCSQKITAFRSGSFFSNLDTLASVASNNLKFVSNYNISYPNCDYIDHYENHNDVFELEHGLFEFPLTNYMEFPIRKSHNSFQISAASYNEMKKALCFYHDNNMQYCTFLTHSFEFVYRSDSQYSQMSPADALIRRFRRLCEYLGQNIDRFQVIGFNDIDNIETDNSRHVFYESGVVNTVSRYLENVSDRF